MAHYDIITPDEIKLDALNSLTIDVTDTNTVSGLGGSYKDVADSVIADVSRMIDSYLNRRVIVDRIKEDLPKAVWRYNDDLGKYYYYSIYPIVQVETSGATISNDNYRILSGEIERQVDYFGGWKRVDQDLSALQSQLPDLTATPDNLPDDIRRVCQRIVMYELDQAINNTYAQSSVTQTNGGTTTSITRLDNNFIQKELKKLHRHKVLVV